MALLLALTLFRQDSELVESYLEQGKEESAQALRKRGVAAIPALLAVRAKYRERAEYFRLLWDLKKTAVSQDAGAISKILEGVKVDVHFEKAPIRDVLGYVRDFADLSIDADPQASAALETSISVARKGCLVRELLDEVALRSELDWDVRYGVVWFAKPERLWGGGKTSPLPRVNGWVTQKDSDADLAAYLKKTKVSLHYESEALEHIVDFLRDFTGKNIVVDSKIDGRTKIRVAVKDISLADTLAILTIPHGWDVELTSGVICLVDPKKKGVRLTFREQKLEGDDAKLAAKLKETKLSLNFTETSLQNVCEFLEAFLEIKIRIEAGADKPVTLRTKELSAWHTLSLLLSPQELDAKIERGTLVIFDPAKKKE